MDLQTVKQRFGIITHNEAMERALDVAIRVAPTDLSVLVTGESGVGKEFFPQVIHACSARKHSKYIAVNCGAIPEGTIDSELFGHQRSAFTGADHERKGYFEEADGGTIFLDEIAELPQQTQVRLLRVLQAGEFMRVGSSKSQKTNVRVVAATNVDLQRAIAAGRFREDLYYRLNAVPISVPALRERPGDIYLLLRRFAVDVATLYRMPPIAFDADARRMAEEYSWPGNVRQLKNVVEQISAIEERRDITAATLAKYLPPPAVGAVALTEPAGSAFDSERELLYKVLFDLRAELTDLHRMVGELYRERRGSPVAVPEVAGYLTAHPRYDGPAPDERRFEVGEEVVDEPAMTKEQKQRRDIAEALRRRGGRRREAAQDLFMSERTLYRKIKELGIDEY